MAYKKVKGKNLKVARVVAAVLVIIALIVLLWDCNNFFIKMYYPVKFSETVTKYANEFNVDEFWIFAIIKAESNFNEKAESPKHAMGLMQITSNTGKWGAEKIKLLEYKDEYLFKPDFNVRIGTWYFAKLLKEFGNNTELALAAYNGGSGNVHRWLSQKIISTNSSITSGIPYKETRDYVKKVKKLYLQYRKLYENNN